MKEELIENGIVVKSKNGTAEISVLKNEYCEECTASVFCKTSDGMKNLLIAKDPFGVEPGDFVKIAISGFEVVKASLMLYGIPLFLILIGIIIGLELFKFSLKREFLSFLFGLSLTGIYYLGLYISFKKGFSVSPKIISVRKISTVEETI